MGNVFFLKQKKQPTKAYDSFFPYSPVPAAKRYPVEQNWIFHKTHHRAGGTKGWFGCWEQVVTRAEWGSLIAASIPSASLLPSVSVFTHLWLSGVSVRAEQQTSLEGQICSATGEFAFSGGVFCQLFAFSGAFTKATYQVQQAHSHHALHIFVPIFVHPSTTSLTCIRKSWVLVCNGLDDGAFSANLGFVVLACYCSRIALWGICSQEPAVSVRGNAIIFIYSPNMCGGKWREMFAEGKSWDFCKWGEKNGQWDQGGLCKLVNGGYMVWYAQLVAYFP